MDKPNIFTAKNLLERPNEIPTVILQPNGKLKLNPDILPPDSEQKDMEFDMVVDFGLTLKHLQEPVPVNERIISNQPHLTILGLRDPDVISQMSKITEIANDPAKNPDNPQDRKEYRNNLKQIYQKIAYALKEKIGDDETAILAPKNGGKFVKEIAEKILTGENIQWIGYRMSRIQKKDGGLMVGTIFDENNPDLSKAKKLVFFDDCMASFISCKATLEMIKSDLVEKGVEINSKEILIAVSAGVQRSMQEITSDEAQKYFGFKDINALTGILVYAMNDHYHLISTEIDPKTGEKIIKQVVGDMGSWTKPIE